MATDLLPLLLSAYGLLLSGLLVLTRLDTVAVVAAKRSPINLSTSASINSPFTTQAFSVEHVAVFGQLRRFQKDVPGRTPISFVAGQLPVAIMGGLLLVFARL